MVKPSDNGTLSCSYPVFKTRMAFIIPIDRVKESVRRKINSKFEPKVHFVNQFNVPAKYLPIDETIGPNCPKLTKHETFLSKPSGLEKERVSRDVKLSFYLLRYTLKRVNSPEYALIMLAELELDSASCSASPHKFFTPHDIVALKKAAIADSLGHNLIKGIVKDISPEGFARFNELKVKGTVINIRATLLNSPSDHPVIATEFNKRFYPSDSRPVTMSSFLKTNINGYMRPHDTACSDMERWVYGLLHTNDNFMMADDSAVMDNVENFYSNNFVERYWASPSTVLTVKVASPFLNPDENCQAHDDDFCNFDSLVETCLLITLGRKINTLLRRHDSMRYHEIENRKAEIATCFNYTITNLFELDEKLRFFIRRSNLQERYDRVIRIVTPRRNIIEKYHSEFIAISSVVITFISLIVAILTLLNN